MGCGGGIVVRMNDQKVMGLSHAGKKKTQNEYKRSRALAHEIYLTSSKVLRYLPISNSAVSTHPKSFETY